MVVTIRFGIHHRLQWFSFPAVWTPMDTFSGRVWVRCKSMRDFTCENRSTRCVNVRGKSVHRKAWNAIRVKALFAAHIGTFLNRIRKRSRQTGVAPELSIHARLLLEFASQLKTEKRPPVCVQASDQQSHWSIQASTFQPRQSRLRIRAARPGEMTWRLGAYPTARRKRHTGAHKQTGESNQPVLAGLVHSCKIRKIDSTGVG